MLKFLTLACGFLLIGNTAFAETEFLTGELAQKFELLDEPIDSPLVGLVDIDGKTIDPKNLKGKVLAVNFWATWCAPCKHEMPTLDKAAKQWGDKGLHVVAVSVDSKAKKGSAYLEKQGLDGLNFAYDAGMKTMRNLGGLGVPLTIVYNADGMEVGRLAGTTDWANGEAEKLFAHFLQDATEFN